MNEEITKVLLNGMPLAVFIAYTLASYFGAIAWFLIKTVYAINRDPKTPPKFNKKYSYRGLFKLGITFFVLPWAVVYFEDYAPIILDLLFKLGESDSNELLVELTAGSSFILGFMMDVLIRRVTKDKFKNMQPKDNTSGNI